MQITGTVKNILPVEIVGQNNTPKQTFVIETDGNYPKLVAFQTWKDMTKMSDNLAEGETVTVHFDVQSREYKEKYYTDLKAWKIDVDGASPKQPEPDPILEPEIDDDLPF
jgi:hypothetical protein